MTKLQPFSIVFVPFLVGGCFTESSSSEGEVSESGECLSAEDAAAATVIDVSTLTAVDIDMWTENPVTAVITSEEELNLFIEQNQVYSIGTVNFDESNLIIAALNVGSTCGDPEPLERLLQHNDMYHFEIEVHHNDGLCQEVCDMAWMISVAYTLPKTQETTSCARLIKTCEQ